MPTHSLYHHAITLVGLDHVQLTMPPGGETAARQFYGELLGLTELAKPAPLAVRGGCWFENAHVQIHLGVQADDFVPSRRGHPAFLTPDLEATRHALIEAGVVVTPDTVVPNVRRFYAYDPFGNRLEFIQDGDGFSQRQV